MQNLCSYGCGKIAKYKTRDGKPMCCPHSTQCPINKQKNVNGLKNSYITGKRDAKQIYNNLSNEKKQNINHRKGKLFCKEEYFGILPDFKNHRLTIKNKLIEERGYKCEKCTLHEWLGETIVLELEHENGDNKDNRRENLKLLCPNCHSQTKTWRKKKSAVIV